MLSRRIIMTLVAPSALALAFAACAAQAQSSRAAEDHHKRGLALGQRGELDRAIDEFDKAIELSPRLADAWFNRGIAYYSKGDPDRAMADLSQAIALDPRHSMAHYNRGVILKSRGELDKAMADFNRAIELNHRFAEAYTHRGRIRYDRGDVDGALADYDKAIKFGADSSARYPSGPYLVSASNPVLGMAYNNRGIGYLQQGREAEPQRDFDQCPKIDPTLRPELKAVVGEARRRLRDLR